MFLSEPMWNLNMSTFIILSLDVIMIAFNIIEPVWWQAHREAQIDPSIYIWVALWQNVTDPCLDLATQTIKLRNLTFEITWLRDCTYII